MRSKQGVTQTWYSMTTRDAASLICALLLILVSYTSHAEVDGYVISPGDTLSIKVFDEPELTLESIKVSADGMIPYPLLGRVQVAGHTVVTLEKHIAFKLKQGYLYRPQVTVSVIDYRPLFLRGKVKQPGALKYTEGLTVEQAIATAGGILEGHKLTEVTLTREGSEDISVAANFKVQPGDTLTIGTSEVKKDVVEESGDYIYLYGEVKKPGSFPYREGLTVEKAIALAGGFGVRASKGKIDISREVEGEGTKKLKKVSLTEPVLPGDVITVGESWF